MFFTDTDAELYETISAWVTSNNQHIFYLIVGQQANTNFETFCKAVVDAGKIPVIITNVSSSNSPYSIFIRNAMRVSPVVRVYEVAKMAMTDVLKAKADLFIRTNGGIVWIP
jgi:hypothetical protein